MDAQEARQIADTANTNKNDKQYKQIKDKITDASTQGLYESTYYNTILPLVSQQLKEEGFKIKSLSAGINEIDWIISW